MADLTDREKFEAHVLNWTGRDIAYHMRAKTTGMEFGWSCWQAAPGYRWQPIETAPRDNKTPLLLARFTADGKLQSFDFDGIWDHETDGWENGDNISYFWASAFGTVEEPTHWMYQPGWFTSVLFS